MSTPAQPPSSSRQEQVPQSSNESDPRSPALDDGAPFSVDAILRNYVFNIIMIEKINHCISCNKLEEAQKLLNDFGVAKLKGFFHVCQAAKLDADDMYAKYESEISNGNPSS